MKVLVVGAGGMLGKEVVKQCIKLGTEVVGLDHGQLNIIDRVGIVNAIDKIKPNCIINCAGIVKGREVPESTYIQVNTYGPHLLHEICDIKGVYFVQVSTDCVFDGSHPHYETDPPDAVDIYGKSKACGESGDLIVRTSFIGIGERGLIAWLTNQKGSVSGYKNVKWNGLCTNHVAKGLLYMVAGRKTGIYHLYGQDTTKLKVLQHIKRLFQLKDVIIFPSSIPKSDYRLRHHKNGMFVDEPLEEQLEELIVNSRNTSRS